MACLLVYFPNLYEGISDKDLDPKKLLVEPCLSTFFSARQISSSAEAGEKFVIHTKNEESEALLF